MIIKIMGKILPVITLLVKDLADGKVSGEEREALIITAALTIAEIVQMAVEAKKH